MYKQGASLVDAALESGDLFKGDGFAHVKQAFEGHTLHLIGLLSNGGVHARYEQLKQLFQGAYEHGAKRIRLHILTDGRDVPDGSSIEFVGQLEKDLEQLRAIDFKLLTQLINQLPINGALPILKDLCV